MERIPNGAAVEVQDIRTGIWLSGGVVVRSWSCARIATGERYVQYDVDGKDSDGPWHGTWDAHLVRLAVQEVVV